MSGLAALRAACSSLMDEARFVEIDTERARGLADQFDPAPPAIWDEDTHFRGDDEATLAYVLTLDTMNFGSGWFPHFHKRPGRSGYFVISMGLKEAFETEGPFSARTLSIFEPDRVAELLGQPRRDAELAEFFALQARALRDLGTLLAGEFGGTPVALRERAGRSALALVELLGRMPLFRDAARTAAGLRLPFYKRAQIAVSDLATAFRGETFGAFDDLAELTAFADNTLPNVLRCEGVLRYETRLAAKIEEGVELAPGCPQELELRAAAVHAVEIMAGYLRGRGVPVEARALDAWLWERGQGAAYKARPRHRTRCAFY